jgi:hypothetical protein
MEEENYYFKNRLQRLEYQKAYNQKNKEKVSEYQHKYYKTHRGALTENRKSYIRLINQPPSQKSVKIFSGPFIVKLD